MLNQIESIVSPIIFPEKALSPFDEEEVDILMNKTTKPPRSIIEKINLFSNITKAEQLIIEKKLNVREKYENKKNSLHCINTLILNAIIWNIKNSLLINEKPNPDKLEIFEKYKMYLSRMLSVLYYGRIRAKRWLTYLYDKLLNIADTETNKMIMEKKFINREFCFKNIEDAYKKCEDSNFIPKNPRLRTEDEFYSFYKVFDIIEQLYNNEEMNRGYIYEKMFSMENITLYFLQDQYKIIFGQMSVRQFDWQVSKNSIEKCKRDIDMIYLNREWSIEPFLWKLNYHLKFQQIVFTHILQYILFHMIHFLDSCSTKTSVVCCDCSPTQMSINQYRNLWHLIVEPLKTVNELLGFKDTLLNQILIIFEAKSPKQSQYQTLYYQVKILHRRCLQELKVPLTFTAHERSCDEIHDEIDKVAIEMNIRDFESYITGVKTLLNPIDNSLFFIRFLYQDLLFECKQEFFPCICEYRP
ncbi:uncharacterized protein LOC126899466 isoform X1 [Daktulosphaira vitifoliae]|uniref:uncharacterized protein LOC126899466 isoform X1 n=1 Tax=Daktulosphaira vitifoliae TaxID=58002 RepID=UPI0021AA31B4|nr:uncharacterized protein LOC126899466 isoform X1 [Daktulosphaira vitifoliae]